MNAAAIRHDATGRTIVAYLSAAEDVRQAWRIVDYMALMHAVESEATRATLTGLVQTGKIERVGRGLYRR